MSLIKNKEELTNIDQNTKNIVFGFIRRCEQYLPSDKNSFYIIPQLVIHHCLFYYHEPECFEKSGTKIQIIDKLQILMNNERGYGVHTAYGNGLIKSFRNRNIYQWTFKIIEGGEGVLVIGITSKHNEPNEAFYQNINTENYGFNAFNGDKVRHWQWKRYGDAAPKGSIVIMTLNMKAKTISFTIDGVSPGVAYNTITTNPHTNYKMAVGLQDHKDSVLLDKFEIL